jgi:hypothetical protein
VGLYGFLTLIGGEPSARRQSRYSRCIGLSVPMSAQITLERVIAQMQHYDRCIGEAESRIDAQERLIRESGLVGRSTTQESFELQKMQLLLSILREARERLFGPLPSAS